MPRFVFSPSVRQGIALGKKALRPRGLGQERAGARRGALQDVEDRYPL